MAGAREPDCFENFFGPLGAIRVPSTWSKDDALDPATQFSHLPEVLTTLVRPAFLSDNARIEP
jgi:hypothetical protein